MSVMKCVFSHLLLFCAFLFSTSSQVVGQDTVMVEQDRINISAGIGLPELLNASFRLQLPQAQVGISYGFIPLQDETVYAVSGDVFYHFAGYSALSSRKVWYGRGGLTFLHDETEELIEKYVYLNLRGGRDLNITRKIGVGVDFGFSFELFYEETQKPAYTPPPFTIDFEFDYPFLPSIGVSLFYRI